MSCAPLRLRYFKVPSGRVHDGQMVMVHASTEALLERVLHTVRMTVTIIGMASVVVMSLNDLN